MNSDILIHYALYVVGNPPLRGKLTFPPRTKRGSIVRAVKSAVGWSGVACRTSSLAIDTLILRPIGSATKRLTITIPWSA